MVKQRLDLFSGEAMLANIASVGWCRQAWVYAQGKECLNLCSGEEIVAFVRWRVMLLSPAWAGVGMFGFVLRWANA